VRHNVEEEGEQQRGRIDLLERVWKKKQESKWNLENCAGVSENERKKEKAGCRPKRITGATNPLPTSNKRVQEGGRKGKASYRWQSSIRSKG